ALREAWVQRISDRAGGVPWCAEEFTTTVRGPPAPGAGAEALLPHEVPATLQDLVMARLDRLEGDREVVQLASALGREFDYELLAAVSAAGEAVLRGELEKLVRAEIPSPKARPPRCSYTFKHALLQDAAYNSLVRSKRQQFHRQIAAALEVHFPQAAEARPELLAHHCTEGGLTERAVGCWLRAGLRSRE